MSKRIHITLVGGQPVPVYQGILATSPDIVLMVCSKETKEHAEIIQNLTMCESHIIIVDPVSFEDINDKINNALSLHEYQEVSTNISGGTKIMSLVLFTICQRLDKSQIFYITQNNAFLDLKSLKYFSPQIFIGIKTLFALSGHPLRNCSLLTDFSEEELSCASQVRKMLKFSKGEYCQLIIKQEKQTGVNHLETKQGSKYEYDSKKKELSLTLVNKEGKQCFAKFSGKSIVNIVKRTQWFELEVALIMQKWQYNREMFLNVCIPSETGNDKNEIDIVLNTGNRLLFIECKLQVNDIKDIDKFRNVTKNYGGLGAKSILITDSPINERVKEKCIDNKIQTFCVNEIGGFKTCEDALFTLLESEIETINPV